MAALVAQQALVVLEAWQDVDRAPEARPACEAAGAHVGGDQAGGGADCHINNQSFDEYPLRTVT